MPEVFIQIAHSNHGHPVLWSPYTEDTSVIPVFWSLSKVPARDDQDPVVLRRTREGWIRPLPIYRKSGFDWHMFLGLVVIRLGYVLMYAQPKTDVLEVLRVTEILDDYLVCEPDTIEVFRLRDLQLQEASLFTGMHRPVARNWYSA